MVFFSRQCFTVASYCFFSGRSKNCIVTAVKLAVKPLPSWFALLNSFWVIYEITRNIELSLQSLNQFLVYVGFFLFFVFAFCCCFVSFSRQCFMITSYFFFSGRSKNCIVIAVKLACL